MNCGEPRRASFQDGWFPFAFAAVCALPHLYKLTLPSEYMFNGLISDDVFYYYKVALNIHKGLGPTFDGLNATNGWHPLWMAVCVALAYVTTNLSAYLYLALAANLGFALALSWQLYRLFGNGLGPWFSLLLAFLVNWNIQSSMAVFSGLETPLYLWLFYLTLGHLAEASLRNKRRLALLGALLGLTFLARTEFALFLPILGIWWVYRFRKAPARDIVTGSLWAFLPFFLLTAPYLLWNCRLTGHFQQISGAVKNLYGNGMHSWRDVFSAVVFHLKYHLYGAIAVVPLWLNAAVMALLALAAWACIRSKSYRGYVGDARFALMIPYAALVVAYYFFSYGKHTRIWHMGVYFTVFHTLLVHMLRDLWRLARRNTGLKWATAALVAALIGGIAVEIPCVSSRWRRRDMLAYVRYSYQLAEWIRDHLPEDCVIGAWDAGIVGYFSERQVVNLDGLVNGREFYNYLKQGQGCFGKGILRYIIDKRLDYVANYFYGPPAIEEAFLSERAELAHHVGRTEATLEDGRKTFLDAYVWRIKKADGSGEPG